MAQPLHQYLVISRGQWDEDASPQDVQRAIDQFYDWHQKQVEAGRMAVGSRLGTMGRVVTRSGITDGPFAEAKELVGGYWFVFAESLDAAAALLAQNPCLAYGIQMEIRPLLAESAQVSVLANETPASWQLR